MHTLLWIIGILLVFLSATVASGQERAVTSFETEADIAALKANATQLATTRAHVTDGKQALQVTFLPAEWPNVALAAKPSWDWRGAGGLAIDITNPGTEPVSFGVRIDDDLRADGNVHCRTGQGTIAPGKTEHFLAPLGPDPMSVGMRGLPADPGLHSLGAGGSGPFALSHIVAFQVFLHQPKTPTTLILDNVRLAPPVSLEKIVDRFGQYTRAEWPGKVKTEPELAQRRAAEQADLKAAPHLPDRDRYGGWSGGPKLAATGFFRTEQRDGKWWLVTPEGHLFFSLGIDCIGTEASTFLTRRETMFTWLPDASDPLARHRGHTNFIHSGPIKEGDTFNFYTANLERKYGADWNTAWIETALKRLPAWGFNTLGNWSDERLYRNGRVPYVATAGIEGEHAKVSSGSDYWGQMHDPFDPRFAEDVTRSLAPVVAKVKGDPWCLGYFVDNELSWGGWGDDSGRYGLAYGALAAESGSPAKQAFLADLRGKYPDIAGLNAAWGTHFTAWSDLESPIHLPSPPNAQAAADMGAFVKRLALHYFRTIRDALKQADPNHLYLGCRFAWRTPEAVEAAAEVCDVVSFNIYDPRVDPQKWGFVSRLGKPCIIGEFHFGALDRGMFHPGLVSTPNQQARAAMYRDYVGSVLDNPAFVGCHWFQYIDEPLTGRTYDGENYNIGFIDVTDTPYPEMVAAARAIHAQAYIRRSSAR